MREPDDGRFRISNFEEMIDQVWIASKLRAIRALAPGVTDIRFRLSSGASPECGGVTVEEATDGTSADPGI